MRSKFCFQVIIFLIAILSVSCNTNKLVQIDGGQLVITDFEWGIGIVGFNAVHGDFATLDNEVFDALKGKSGVFSIQMVYNRKDSYGNDTKNTDNVGTISADELNKYQDVTYWVNSTGGMQSILVKR
jgi:hypothetical protein